MEEDSGFSLKPRWFFSSGRTVCRHDTRIFRVFSCEAVRTLMVNVSVREWNVKVIGQDCPSCQVPEFGV